MRLIDAEKFDHYIAEFPIWANMIQSDDAYIHGVESVLDEIRNASPVPAVPTDKIQAQLDELMNMKVYGDTAITSVTFACQILRDLLK